MTPRIFAAASLVAALGGAFMYRPGVTAVRVVDDEVIFTVVAPGAKTVFLVGDFNNWNPTIEKMSEDGGRFAISLFLVPGRYRYKFVVDGRWIADPDNPPEDPRSGSVIVLREKAGALILSTDELETEEESWTLEPGARYIGQFILDEGNTRSHQFLDLSFRGTGGNVSSIAVFKTGDDLIDLSRLKSAIHLYRGHLQTQLGSARITGFENDTMWTSNDPFTLVGDVGIYHYNGGYDRRGFFLELPMFLNTTLRAMYGDKLEPAPARPPAVPKTAFSDFENSGGADTTVYRYQESFHDEDAAALELFMNAGRMELGYAKRRNNGFHPGILVDVVRNGAQLEVTSYSTREFWNADVLWFRYRLGRKIGLTGGYGSADAYLWRAARSFTVVDTLEDVSVGETTEAMDRRDRFQQSRRWRGNITYEAGALRVTLGYDWNRFTFERPLYEASNARVGAIGASAAYAQDGLKGRGQIRFVDQDYGGAPPDFHYDTPARNFWLDYADRLTVERMAVFDLERYVDLDVAFSWHLRPPFGGVEEAAGPPLGVRAEASMVTEDFFERLRLATVRVGIRRALTTRFYTEVDSRMSHYAGGSGTGGGTYVAPHVEAGFRGSRMEVSVGYGLDPIVLDGATNAYRDIGREEFLRRALFTGLRRGDGTILETGLRARERLLQDTHAFKLEFVVLF